MAAVPLDHRNAVPDREEVVRRHIDMARRALLLLFTYPLLRKLFNNAKFTHSLEWALYTTSLVSLLAMRGSAWQATIDQVLGNMDAVARCRLLGQLTKMRHLLIKRYPFHPVPSPWSETGCVAGWLEPPV